MADRVQRFPGAEKPRVEFTQPEAAVIYASVQAMLMTLADKGQDGPHIHGAIEKLGKLLGEGTVEQWREQLDRGTLPVKVGFLAIAQ